MHWATPAAPYIGCHFRDISEPTLGCPHSLLTLRLLRYKNHLEWDLRTGHADAKLAFCLLDLPLSHGILSALGRGAGTLVNHRAMAPISLLTSPGQQWKSLCLLSMQIKIIAANNEKLNGCHWAKPNVILWPPWPPRVSCLGQPFSAITCIYQRDTVIALGFFE